MQVELEEAVAGRLRRPSPTSTNSATIAYENFLYVSSIRRPHPDPGGNIEQMVTTPRWYEPIDRMVRED
jgi:hypothetical protein